MNIELLVPELLQFLTQRGVPEPISREYATLWGNLRVIQLLLGDDLDDQEVRMDFELVRMEARLRDRKVQLETQHPALKPLLLDFVQQKAPEGAGPEDLQR
ncbi:hypothetical protein [Deinococcus roseus]|uniref:Uncharacterized protein n=1 Tax=Deinococcus roseus TaxID=392414 RepID=A0ABQ2CWG6_9DEIO|nr:hypothetical protein [Deinococcus roseus]GGJ23558.1 hypothetical protein GCM10008938_07160 [Deinococcus roseus]